MQASPSAVLTLSATFYSALLRTVIGPGPPRQDVEGPIKGISAFHSLTTSLVALYTLRYTRWDVPGDAATAALHPNGDPKRGDDGNLNDSNNPLIAGRSRVANALTAWEAGYLVYDTGALIYQSYVKSRGSLPAALLRLAKDSPIIFAHHISLIAALGYLQTYIAAGEEKGVWIIVAFILMNASNPLLHARWWMRKKTSKISNKFDLTFAAVFALSRFGVVAWVLERYGAYHRLRGWNAYKKLRWQCRVGTAALVGFNAVWWVMLLLRIMRRLLLRRSRS